MSLQPALVQSLVLLKSRPLFFAFAGNNNKGELVLDPKKIQAKEITRLQRLQLGPVFSGVCRLDDATFVFELEDDPPPTLVTALKAALKRHADANNAVRTLYVPPPEPDENEQASKETEEEQKHRLEEERETGRYVDEVKVGLRVLSGRLKTHRESLSKEEAQQFAEDILEIQRLLSSDPRAALALLEKTSARLEAPKAPPTLGALAGPVQDALKGPNGERVAKLLERFELALARDDHDTTGAALTELEAFVLPKRSTDDERWSGVKVDEYTPSERLGAGGFGEVWAMRPPSPGMPGLVKKTGLGEKGQKALAQERAIYEKLGPHPNIPRFLGVTEEGGKTTALFMERVEGRDTSKVSVALAKRFREGKLPPDKFFGAVQHMVRQTLEVMSFLADHGLAHNDIKSPNVMVDEKTGQVKVVDLGGVTEEGVPHYLDSPGWTDSVLASHQHDVHLVGKLAATLMEGGTGLWARGLKAGPTPLAKKKNLGQVEDFVRWLTTDDKGRRPTAKEALAHPFLADALLDDDEAAEVLRGGGEDAFEWTPGLTLTAWTRSLEAAKAAGGTRTRTIEEAEAYLRTIGDAPLWDQVHDSPAAEDTVNTWKEALVALRGVLEKRKSVEELEKTGLPATFGRYFAELDQLAEKALSDLELGGLPEVTRSGFAARWLDIEGTAKKAVESLGKELRDWKKGEAETVVDAEAYLQKYMHEKPGKKLEDRRKQIQYIEEETRRRDEAQAEIRRIDDRLKLDGLGVGSAEKFYLFKPSIAQAMAKLDQGEIHAKDCANLVAAVRLRVQQQTKALAEFSVNSDGIGSRIDETDEVRLLVLRLDDLHRSILAL